MTDDLQHEERRDILTFGLAVVGGLTVIGCVAVARSDAGATTWAAIGAIAAAIQAVGVVGALFYAQRTISTARRLDQERRRHQHIDELNRAFTISFEPVVRRIHRSRQQLFRAIHEVDSANFWPALEQLRTLTEQLMELADPVVSAATALELDDVGYRLHEAAGKLANQFARTEVPGWIADEDWIRSFGKDLDRLGYARSLIANELSRAFRPRSSDLDYETWMFDPDAPESEDEAR